MSQNRRHFLRTIGLAALSVSAFGCAAHSKEEERFIGDCTTTDDILGPFYRPGAPERADLTYDGQKGDNVKIVGRVYGSDCTTPLKSALVEIWLADAEGAYDNTSDAYRNRGLQKTNDAGNYHFKTIVPGRYLNGNQFRPSHIHFRVTAQGHKELISQIYFAGDPYIEKDPWAGKPKAEKRILTLDKTKNLPEISFDIFLEAMT